MESMQSRKTDSDSIILDAAEFLDNSSPESGDGHGKKKKKGGCSC